LANRNRKWMARGMHDCVKLNALATTLVSCPHHQRGQAKAAAGGKPETAWAGRMPVRRMVESRSRGVPSTRTCLRVVNILVMISLHCSPSAH